MQVITISRPDWQVWPRKEKIEVIPWQDFFAKTRVPQQQKRALSLTGVTLVAAAPAIIQTGTKDAILNAFWPIIDLVQGISYPICFLMIVGGMLLIITGNRSRGIDMIKWAIVGYLGLQFAPAIMKILLNVGNAMQTGGIMPLSRIAV